MIQDLISEFWRSRRALGRKHVRHLRTALGSRRRTVRNSEWEGLGRSWTPRRGYTYRSMWANRREAWPKYHHRMLHHGQSDDKPMRLKRWSTQKINGTSTKFRCLSLGRQKFFHVEIFALEKKIPAVKKLFIIQDGNPYTSLIRGSLSHEQRKTKTSRERIKYCSASSIVLLHS